jgi:hypothetical protein
MKLLVIICSHEFNIKWCDNIIILNNYLNYVDISYCGISSQNDFYNYEHIIQFKYKVINTKLQFSKICDFITNYKNELNYDWYIKIRPDIKLLEPINFNMLSDISINARARIYYGPKKIKYGMSVNGAGIWQNIGDKYYSENENNIVLDDMFFVFHHNIIKLNAFDTINDYTPGWEEKMQTNTFTNRNIHLNVIGINLENTKYNTLSGDI